MRLPATQGLFPPPSRVPEPELVCWSLGAPSDLLARMRFPLRMPHTPAAASTTPPPMATTTGALNATTATTRGMANPTTSPIKRRALRDTRQRYSDGVAVP